MDRMSFYAGGRQRVYARDEILLEIFGQNVTKLLGWELCDKLFCRELVTKVRLDEHIAMGEDKLFFWQAMKGMKHFAYQPTYGYHYRMREGSAIHSGLTAKSLTVCRANEQIFADAGGENGALRNVLWEQYALGTITAARGWLILGAEEHRQEIKHAQNFLRVQRLPCLSLRQRLGTLYLSLPFPVCKALRLLVKKSND